MPDVILFWNDVALEANRRDFSRPAGDPEQGGPTLSSRALAIVHLAMYDAYTAVITTGAARPYLADLPPLPPGVGGQASSARAAAAAAAHAALSSLYPSQKPMFDLHLGQSGDVHDAGHDFGVAVTEALLDARMQDPGAGAGGYTPSGDRYRHRPDPDNPMQGFHAPFYGARSRLFVARERFGLERPPQGDDHYREALNQVRRLGIAPELIGTLLAEEATPSRTPTETLIGIFWGYDGAHLLGTPPRLYNQIIRRVAINQGNTEAENAELFMLVNAAMGDAGILAWEQKYCHDFWRPVVGIREHDASLGPGAATPGDALAAGSDPAWLPLGAPATNELLRVGPAQPVSTFPANQMVQQLPKNFTPPFPAYPSGHATFGAAAFHVTRLFYRQGGTLAGNDLGRDDLFDDLDFVSDEFNGMSQDNRGTVRPRHLRKFPNGLWGMILENALSRVYLGVHWVFDAFLPNTPGGTEPNWMRNVGGVPLGLRIAEDIYESFCDGAGPLMSSVGPRPGSELFGNCEISERGPGDSQVGKAASGRHKPPPPASRRPRRQHKR